MKKILALAVGMLLIPFTAFGMQMMSEADMDSITGQSGVAISLDNIQLYSDEGGSEFWFETSLDGTTAAAVGLVYEQGSASYTFLNKVASPAALAGGGSGFGNVAGNAMLRGNYDPLQEMYGAGLAAQGTRNAPAVLSIRVVEHHANGIFGAQATLDALGAPVSDGAHIEIGLPTLEIFRATGSADIFSVYVMAEGAYGGVDTTNPLGSNGFNYSIGTIYTTDAGTTTTILGGRLGITSFGQLPAILTNQGDL